MKDSLARCAPWDENPHVRRFPALIAAAAVAAALVVAPTASPTGSSNFIRSGIFDDAQVLYGNPDKLFPALKAANTETIRVNLWWGGPNGVASNQPAKPSDPADPAYNWATYDRTVRYADAYSIRVLFSIIGTPNWANGAKGWNVAPTRPADLQQFAIAAARRYSGKFIAPDDRPLPRVIYWLAWNEPNNPVFLRPQYRNVAGNWQIQSAKDYAAICNAVVVGIKAVKGSGRVACGATGPRGNNNPNTDRASVSPLAFMRAMKAAGARGFDAYDHHPYYGMPSETPSTKPPPGIHGNEPTAITLGNFDVFLRELTRVYGSSMRVWVTEYGYQTNPPDGVGGVSWAKQAVYLKEAYQIVRRNRRVDLFLWFLFKDEIRPDGWQSGLLTADGRKKPAYNVFRTMHG